MTDPPNQPALRWLPWAVAGVAALVFFINLGGPLLFDEDEPKNASCGREMLERGDWIVPSFNGQLRTDKPILIYWVMLLAYNLFGVNEFSARFGSALAGVGSVTLTYHLGRMLLDRWAGALAAALLASGLMFAVLSRASTPDALLICCVTASLCCFVAGVAALRGGRFSGATGGYSAVSETKLPLASWLGMYAAMGLAILAKGPAGVVLPMLVVLLWLVFFDIAPAEPVANSGKMARLATALRRRLAPRRLLSIAGAIRLAPGTLIALAIAAPWYIAVGIETDGAWLQGFLGNHNVNRFLQPMENHRGPIVYYPLAILVGFFPGSVFLPAALWGGIRRLRGDEPLSPSLAMLLCWIGGYVGFFTIAATKLPNYVSPCYPAVALVTAWWLRDALQKVAPPVALLRFGYASLGVFGLAAGLGLSAVSLLLLDGGVLIGLPAVAAVAGAVAAWVMLSLGDRRSSGLVFAAGCLLFTATAMSVSTQCASPHQEGPRLAESIRRLDGSLPAPSSPESSAQPPTRVGLCGYFAPTVVYYLGRPVEQVPQEGLAEFLAGPGPSIVLMPADLHARSAEHLPAGTRIIADQKRFLRRNGRIVMLTQSVELARSAERILR